MATNPVFDFLMVSTQTDAVIAIASLVVVLILLFIGTGIAAYFLIQKIRYPYTVLISKNEGNGYGIIRRDKAQILKVDRETGFQLLWLKKTKVYRMAYQKLAGLKTYLFVIGSDGLWYGSTLGDFDKKRYELGFSPVEKDARSLNIHLRNIVAAKHKTKDLSQVIGLIMMGGVILFLIVAGILFYLNYSKWNEMAKTNSAAIRSSKELVDSTVALQNQTTKLIQTAAAIFNQVSANKASGVIGPNG